MGALEWLLLLVPSLGCLVIVAAGILAVRKLDHDLAKLTGGAAVVLGVLGIGFTFFVVFGLMGAPPA